jgi:hypothetical protein
MSETSTLIGYSGRTIGREELALVPTPTRRCSLGITGPALTNSNALQWQLSAPSLQDTVQPVDRPPDLLKLQVGRQLKTYKVATATKAARVGDIQRGLGCRG